MEISARLKAGTIAIAVGALAATAFTTASYAHGGHRAFQSPQDHINWHDRNSKTKSGDSKSAQMPAQYSPTFGGWVCPVDHAYNVNTNGECDDVGEPHAVSAKVSGSHGLRIGTCNAIQVKVSNRREGTVQSDPAYAVVQKGPVQKNAKRAVGSKSFNGVRYNEQRLITVQNVKVDKAGKADLWVGVFDNPQGAYGHFGGAHVLPKVEVTEHCPTNCNMKASAAPFSGRMSAMQHPETQLKLINKEGAECQPQTATFQRMQKGSGKWVGIAAHKFPANPGGGQYHKFKDANHPNAGTYQYRIRIVPMDVNLDLGEVEFYMQDGEVNDPNARGDAVRPEQAQKPTMQQPKKQTAKDRAIQGKEAKPTNQGASQYDGQTQYEAQPQEPEMVKPERKNPTIR